MTGEPGARPLVGEVPLRKRAGRGEPRPQRRGQSARAQPVAEPKQRPGRDRMRTEHHSLNLTPRLDQRADQSPVRELVAAEPRRRCQQAVLEQDGRPIVERMGRRRTRLDPLDVELERPEERRSQTERVDRRADVVDESRQRQLGRPQAAAELLRGFVNLDLQAGSSQRDRRRETVRP